MRAASSVFLFVLSGVACHQHSKAPVDTVASMPAGEMPALVPFRFEVERKPTSVTVRLRLPRGWREAPGIKGVFLYVDVDRDPRSGKRFWGDIGADLACHSMFGAPSRPWSKTWVLNDDNEEVALGSAEIRDGEIELNYPVALDSPFDYVLMVINRSESDPRVQTNWFAPDTARDKQTGHLASN